jgi:hypothetical protein
MQGPGTRHASAQPPLLRLFLALGRRVINAFKAVQPLGLRQGCLVTSTGDFSFDLGIQQW